MNNEKRLMINWHDVTKAYWEKYELAIKEKSTKWQLDHHIRSLKISDCSNYLFNKVSNTNEHLWQKAIDNV